MTEEQTPFEVTEFKTERDGNWFCMRVNPKGLLHFERQKVYAELREWMKENTRVMAHIVGAKRVETKWVDADDLLTHFQELERTKC